MVYKLQLNENFEFHSDTYSEHLQIKFSVNKTTNFYLMDLDELDHLIEWLNEHRKRILINYKLNAECTQNQ